MTKKRFEETQWVSPMLFGTLSIGQWEDDVEANRISGDAVMAYLFGVSEEEMAGGITLERLISLFHPEDRNTDTAHRRRVRADGGAFAWEHRVVTTSGEVRWLLARGRFTRDTDGRVRGQGVVIDMTDTRVHENGPGPAAFLAADGGGPPLERIAERILDAWEIFADLEQDDRDLLGAPFKALLLQLGHQIASTVSNRMAGKCKSLSASKMH